MSQTLDDVGTNTLGRRGSYSNYEIDKIGSFLEYMGNKGFKYYWHAFMVDDPSTFFRDGYAMLSTYNPELGILFVKIESGRGIFGKKKYVYQAYLSKDIEMRDLKEGVPYKDLRDALISIADIRQGMKLS
jgi:hypothetical protein